MWCFINHTKQHIVRTELYDIGRKLTSLISFSGWLLIHDIDIEDVDPKGNQYRQYTFDI
jgi:hypothetical protein